MTNSELLSTFIAAYPAQPATAYWRAIEIGALVHYGLPEGLGLDLGCGDGALTEILLSHTGPRQLVGVDPDPLEVEAARRFSCYIRAHVAPGDATPEADETFDFVLSNSVLEHVPTLDETLAEVSRLLKPGGTFLFTVPAPMFRENLRGPVLSLSSREVYLQTLDRRIAHLNYLDRRAWADALAMNGLRMRAALGYLDAAETRRWENLSRMTGGLLYSVFGERKPPIEIQRGLGIRDIQNRRKLPAPLAAVLASAVSLGADIERNAGAWLDPDSASCLLLVGEKR